MAIAQHKTVSLAVNTLNSKRLNLRQFWQPTQLSTAWLKRFWWHGKAYGTIFGIMVLTLGSLVFLVADWFYRSLLSVPDHQAQEKLLQTNLDNEISQSPSLSDYNHQTKTTRA